MRPQILPGTLGRRSANTEGDPPVRSPRRSGALPSPTAPPARTRPSRRPSTPGPGLGAGAPLPRYSTLRSGNLSELHRLLRPHRQLLTRSTSPRPRPLSDRNEAAAGERPFTESARSSERCAPRHFARWPLAWIRERMAAILYFPRSAGRRVGSCPNARAISQAPPACAAGAPVEGHTPSGGFESDPATPRRISTSSRESPRMATPLARGGVDRLDSERLRAVRARCPGKLTAESRFPVRAPPSRSKTRDQAARAARSGLRRARVFARFESAPECS